MKNQEKMANIVCCAVLGMLLCAFSAVADDESSMLEENGIGSESAEESIDQGDSQLTENFLYLGYRWVNGDVSSGAGQYVDDRNTPVLGVKLERFPLPHRIFMHGDYLGPHDFYGDLAYAYSDIILFRDLLVGVHHNLDHYSYLYPGNPPSVTYADRSFGDVNYVDFLKNDLYLRLKKPNYPLHAFFKHGYVERKGTLQERFLLGYFGSLDKVSESRDIDWEADNMTLGFDSHLGPVEVEYAYSWFDFDPGAGSVLFDYYSAGRPPGIYPHNVVPETESTDNTFRMHTSYTGQIVASATLSNEDSDNNYSNAGSDAWRGAFDLQWMPDPMIGMFFRYRHLETERENPEYINLQDVTIPVTYEVRRPVSTKKDLFALSARYRPLGKVTLNGNYEYEMHSRSDVDEWLVLPEDSDVHRIELTARARLTDTLQVKGIYEYQYFADPAYNIEPDNSNKLRLNASYTPASWVMSMLDYRFSISKRDDLRYVNGTSLIEDGEREGRTDQVLASVSFVLSPLTSLTASYAYNKWKIEQDLAYSLWNAAGTTTTDIPYYDRGAPYTDEANILALFLNTKLPRDMGLRAGLSYTIGESKYLPNPSFLTPVSSREITETIAMVGLTKRFMEDWEVGIQCKADFYDEEFSGEDVEQRDDEVYVTMLTLKRYF